MIRPTHTVKLRYWNVVAVEFWIVLDWVMCADGIAALLKVSQSSTGERFLNVIPVDSWWSFKRPAVAQVTTLEEVDAKVEEVRALLVNRAFSRAQWLTYPVRV